MKTLTKSSQSSLTNYECEYYIQNVLSKHRCHLNRIEIAILIEISFNFSIDTLFCGHFDKLQKWIL